MSLYSELKTISLGDHLCMVYDDDEEKLKVLILYILDGLKKKERIFVLNENEEEIRGILKEFVDLESISDQIAFLNVEESYLRGFREFRGLKESNEERLLEMFREIESKAIVDGFRGVRIAGNTPPFHLEKILEGESGIRTLGKTTIICFYDSRKFDGEFLKKVVRFHPKVIWRERVLDNFFELEEDDFPLLMNRILEIGELKSGFQKIEEQFKILFEGRDAVFILREDTFVSCNNGASELLGISKRELIGKKFWEFSPRIQPDGMSSRKKALEMIGAALEEGPQFFEFRFLRKTNTSEEPVDLEISLTRFRTGDSQDYHLMAIARDITERKRMEERLRESEKKYRDLWENAGDILFIIDLEGNFLEANKTGRKLFGYTAEEIKRLNIKDVVDKNFLPAAYVEIERIANSEKSTVSNLELLCYTKDDKAIWIESRAKPIVEDGRVKAIQGIARDITEIKRMNKLLRAVNEINKHLIREKDEFMLIEKASKELNSLGFFLSWIGVKHDDVLVTTSSRIGKIRLGGGDLNCVNEALENQEIVIRGGENSKCEKCEFYHRHKNLVRYAFPMIADGRTRGAFVIYAEGRMMEDELDLLQTLANDLAFAINAIELERAKLRAFEQIERNIENYAILVDQIRNPLAIISGIAEVKLDGKGDEIEWSRRAILESVRRIEEVVERLDKGWLESEIIKEYLRDEHGK